MTATVFLKEVSVKNYRSILDETLTCDDLTALVGANGSGKSSFLNAIQLFYNPSATVTQEDYYNNDTTAAIEIALTFTCLNSAAREQFKNYLDGDRLTVTRIIPTPGDAKNSTYHGVRLQNPDFLNIRDAATASKKQEEYRKLRKQDEYSDLPSATSASAVISELDVWEHRHPEACEHLPDNGQFFGFKQVAQGYLGRYTQCIHVPAVREASDEATEKRGSTVAELMSLTVRSALADDSEVADFKKEMQDRYTEVMASENFEALQELGSGLSEALRFYVPDTEVLLQWEAQTELPIPDPQASIRLRSDDFVSRVATSGHGVQRALIISMLQHLHAVRHSSGPESSDGADGAALPNLVLTIEEPELYQHPSRQRHFAEVLNESATSTTPTAGGSTQIVYTTHSPLFVGLDRFNQVRVLRKAQRSKDQAHATTLKKADIDSVAKELQRAQSDSTTEFTAESLRPRLQALMTPWVNEGFFADIVVLVEGETDVAAITGVARSMGHKLDSLGIAVIPCGGKTCLDRPLVIFRQLDIPVYIIWDGDEGRDDAEADNNRYLLRLLDLPEEDWPDFVGATAACFRVDLEDTLAEEVGRDYFDEWMSQAQQVFGIQKKREARKYPAIVRRIVDKARLEGRTSASLEKIVERILTLQHQADSSS